MTLAVSQQLTGCGVLVLAGIVLLLGARWALRPKGRKHQPPDDGLVLAVTFETNVKRKRRTKSGKARVAEPDQIFTKIRGVQRRRGAVDNCEAGELLQLVREPGNKADSDAIMVFNDEGEQVGYLSKELAEQLAPAIDSGVRYAARVLEVTGQEHDNPGVNIEVWRVGEPSAPR